MKTVNLAFGLALIAGSSPGLLQAIELQSETLAAWNAYIRNADSRMQERIEAGQTFLWADEAPGRGPRLLQGEILVAPGVGHGTQSVPGGLIHDWIGAVFIPKATLDGLLSVVHDYDRYKEFYKPVVADSKGLACTETDQHFSMLWQHRILFVDAAIQGQYEAHDFALDARRGYNIAATTRVQEVERYGKTGERLLPPDQGNGFIWRLQSIARYEARDNGVYLELEAIAMTRDIPTSLGWLLNPVVHRLSINSLATTLRQTRDAVISGAVPPNRSASCGGGQHSLPRSAGLRADGED